MRKAIRYLFAVIGLGLLHSVLLYGVMILAFVGSFGAPQGGDAPGSAEQLAHRAAIQPYLDGFQRVLDFSLSVLSWPGRLIQPFSPGSLAWIITSFVWAFMFLCAFLLFTHFLRRNELRTNVAS